MNELLAQFLLEGRDLVGAAEDALDRLDSHAGDDAALDALFRAVHTLKGSVALFDMKPAEQLLHAAEDRLMNCARSSAPVDRSLLTDLFGVIDLVDRWIDELEARGQIGADAPHLASKLRERLSGGETSGAAGTADDGADQAWTGTLAPSLAALVDSTDVPLILFRYSPDADCFFRGDDPLALVAAVPELVDLAIRPATEWPTIASFDPFRCISILEGASRAPLEAVRTAFRLVPDQILFAQVAPARVEAKSETRATVRVETARLNRLAEEVGELVVATNGLAHLARLAVKSDPVLAERLRATQAEFERIGKGLHNMVSAVRRVPLAPALRRLPRLVREIAQSLDKPVRFEMTGQSAEIDKAIADHIFEPLLHLVRNAIDHGVEPREARAAAGKSTEAVLQLSAAILGDELHVALSDDGRGIDPEAIRALAVDRGLVAPDDAAAMDDPAALRLILRPGFSTAPQVSEVSGRGVGMDSVRTMAEQLGGQLHIDSRVGHGTTMTLRLPLDMITTRLLIVRAGEERFGIRLDQIVETARIPAGAIQAVGTGRACVLRDRTVPLLDLANLMGQPALTGELARLIVTEANGQAVALRVDGLGERIDARVREAEGLLGGLPGIAGTTLLGDGQLLLVLDLPELVA